MINQGLYSQAKFIYESLKEKCREEYGNKYFYVMWLRELGSTYQRLADYNTAEKYFNQSLNLVNKISKFPSDTKKSREIAHCKSKIGDLRYEQRNFKQTIKEYEELIKLLEGDDKYIYLNKSIKAYMSMSVSELARNRITAQQSIQRKFQNFIGRLLNRKSLNDCQLDKVEEILKEISPYFEQRKQQQKPNRHDCLFLRNWADFYHLKRKDDEAEKKYLEVLNLRNELQNTHYVN